MARPSINVSKIRDHDFHADKSKANAGPTQMVQAILVILQIPCAECDIYRPNSSINLSGEGYNTNLSNEFIQIQVIN